MMFNVLALVLHLVTMAVPPHTAPRAASKLARTYYLAPAGNDTNSGLTAAAAWLTPNHPVNCGDTIVAAPSDAYAYANLGSGKWGHVTCASGNNVAWVKCAKFDACKVTVPATVKAVGINVTASYWGVQGWEVNSPGTLPDGLSCFNASPASNRASVHHIIFANNIANTCPLAGFGMGVLWGGTASVDYYVAAGNISYNAGTSNTGCGSGFDVFSPAASDPLPGTHIYLAGNFAFGTVNPANGKCWDGNGIIVDTTDGSTTAGMKPYTEQIAVENNLSVANGGLGLQVEYNSPADYKGPVPAGVGLGKVYVRHNTLWGNSTGVGAGGGRFASGSPDCAEFRAFKIQHVTATDNLAVTNQHGCYGSQWNQNYAFKMQVTDGTSTAEHNWAYSPFGYSSVVMASPGFHYGATVQADPQLAHPVAPSAPDCSRYADVPACMASVVANFTPRNAAAQPYGHQKPGKSSAANPLFPAWLCHVDLPPGLVATSCAEERAGSSGQSLARRQKPR